MPVLMSVRMLVPLPVQKRIYAMPGQENLYPGMAIEKRRYKATNSGR